MHCKIFTYYLVSKHIKPTIKSKDTALKKQKWWKRKIKRKSGNFCSTTSIKLPMIKPWK